jgi:hypothetical protein
MAGQGRAKHARRERRKPGLRLFRRHLGGNALPRWCDANVIHAKLDESLYIITMR